MTRNPADIDMQLVAKWKKTRRLPSNDEIIDVNHRSVTKAGVTLAVYSHYTYDSEKRQALDLWADRLAAIVGTGAAKIAPLTKAKRV